MPPEPLAEVGADAAHLVAGGEAGHVAPDGRHRAGVLVAEDPRLRAPPSREPPQEDRLRPSPGAVVAVEGRGMDSHQHFVGCRDRTIDPSMRSTSGGPYRSRTAARIRPLVHCTGCPDSMPRAPTSSTGRATSSCTQHWRTNARRAVRDTGAVKLYFAGPLFTTPERSWNAEVCAALRGAGHQVFLPQEKEPGKDAAGIFETDVGGIDWADGLVAIVDGPDPDAGTSWEIGYAFGRKKPIILVRTDFRTLAGDAGDYSPMLTQAATIRIDLPESSTAEVISSILGVLARMEAEHPRAS